MTRYPLLNALESQYYYDNLYFIAHNPSLDFREKLKQSNFTFLSVVNTLTEQKEKQIFTGWFAKINFIAQAYGLDARKEAELQSLRRLLKKSVSWSGFRPEERTYLAALKILAELVEQFSENDIPAALKAYYEGIELPTLVFKEEPRETIEYLYATILEKGQIEYDNRERGQIELQCETEEFGLIRVKVQDQHYFNAASGKVFRKYMLSLHCAQLIHPYQTICLTHLEQIEEDYFASTGQTLLIASPDYLVDATTISQCFLGGTASPYLYLLEKLSFFQGNEHTFAGKLINDLLDYYIEHPEADFEGAFRQIFGQTQLEAALLELDRGKLSEIYYKIKPQFLNIQKVLKDFLELEETETKKINTTEPTFISGKYGLQGRLDVLVEYEDQLSRKDILELKGTAFPSPQLNIARRDHLVQVACYNLLTDSTFPGRQGVSAILYSKDEQTPLRDCGKLNFQEQDATWIRNCIVYIDRQIAKGLPDFYDIFIRKLSQLNLPFYKQDAVRNFIKNWQEARPLDKIYFAEFMGLIARERQVAKVGGVSGQEPSQGYASLWRNSVSEKLESFSLLSHLKLEKLDIRKSEISFSRPESATEVTAFRQGDIMVLYPMEKEDLLEPDRYPLLKGHILEIHPHSLKVKIWNKSLDERYFYKYPRWAVEPNLMESSYDHQFASLAAFLSFPEEKRELFLGQRTPRFAEDFQVDYRSVLSEEQNQILNQALAAQDYFLLQGPPGTGKTSKMLRSMVDYLYNHTRETVVLLAFTNRATDEICQKIGEICHHQFIRLGNIQEDHAFRAQSLKEEKDLAKIREKLEHARIFVSTVSSFYNNMHLIKDHDTVIVDEASQLLEPALCGILPRFRRFILIGDEKQLPAVVTQPARFCQTEQEPLHEVGIRDLSVSVFERLLNNAQQKGWHRVYNMLSTQFRTHEAIAQFISQEFYKKLKVGADFQRADWRIFDPHSKDVDESLLANSRLLFIPSNLEENIKFHRGEAKRVAQLLSCIRRIYQQKNAFGAETVGVITPYRAQIAEIYKLLDEELRELVTVDTVERYQGSEREIIILSLAANHPALMKNLQSFNADHSVDKKLNVALSRAKEQLILLGNPDILREGLYYSKLLDYISEQVAYKKVN